MKKSCTLIPVLLFFLLTAGCAYGQQKSLTDTFPRLPAYNAGFDVIIKKNGELVYGLVMEVGQFYIKYKRTDIPDGPVYNIPRHEVYAVSYRNQVTDYLNPVEEDPRRPGRISYDPRRKSTLFEAGNLRLGLGFIRGYTKVDEANQYATSFTFPVVNIAYDTYFRNGVWLGMQLAAGSHKFSRQEYSSYDTTQTDIDLKENIFTLHLYGKYTMTGNSTLKPYAILGLGIHSSYIRSEYLLHLLNDQDKEILVKSGSRSVGIGILARIGADYYLNKQWGVFADAGFGPSVLQAGITMQIQ